MNIFKTRFFQFFILFFILFIAFLLRIQQWYVFLGHDEIPIMKWIWEFQNNPFPVHPYPPFFLYINYILAIIYKTILGFIGVIQFDSSFFSTDFGFIFTLKAGRILTAVFGVALVYFVYRIGRRFFNREVAIVSAFILAVSRPMVIDSHNFKSDILVSLLLTIVLYFSLRYMQTGEPKQILKAAFFLGLSIATKYNAAFMALIVIIPFFFAKKGIKVRAMKQGFIYVLLGGLGGFILGAPNWVVHPIENLKQAFGLLKGIAEEAIWYDPMPSSYILYSKNIWESFGFILVILFIAGLVFSFVKKEKISLLISLYVLFYFVFIGKTNYLNHRAILPIFSGIVLIIGKFLFYDVKSWLKKSPKIKSVFFPLAWMVIAVIISQQFLVNIRSFNLLKTLSSHPVKEHKELGLQDYSRYFMGNHIEPRFSFFREMWTPPVTGYKRSNFGKDITNSSLNRFRGPDAYHFLLTSFRTHYILAQSKNRVIKNEAKRRLKNYLPFYQVYRPRIFTWNCDITFWYRKAKCIKSRVKVDPTVDLPRLFYCDDKNPTICLPLQTYEKNPGFARIKNGIYQKRFFSRNKIEEIRFVFLDPGKLSKIKIKINNEVKHITLDGSSNFKKVLIDNIKPEIYPGLPIRRLWEVSLDEKAKSTPHFLYELEIKTNRKETFFGVFSLHYKDDGKKSKKPLNLPSITDEKIPALFSTDQYPDWVKKFYIGTGIDLSLLSFMNRITLYKNHSFSVKDLFIPYFPLERGEYIIQLKGSKIVENFPVSDQLKLEIEVISEKISRKKTVMIDEKFVQSNPNILLKTGSDINFVKLKLLNTRKSNFLVEELVFSPDYKTYINKNF